jgi:hypothetical protein
MTIEHPEECLLLIIHETKFGYVGIFLQTESERMGDLPC